ncbi:MAG TPA: UDP-glucose 4-epimerase GalE [Sedimentisphaerales bacterium]|nr:UDP-glucose 4-epimerase GalE [Sedimentisphaerales bacterium]
MRVLVCGGAGYIGSNMTAMLVKEGHEPIVYDNLRTGYEQAVRDAELIKGDLADRELLVRTLKSRRIEAVMHFAASIEAGESVRNPLEYYGNNVCNTRTLLLAMEQTGVEKLVFSSTAAVYGTPASVPITEDAPKCAINPYGETKWAVERMCHFQVQAERLRYVALRYFNAAGAGEGGTLGEDHKPETHLIPLAIQAALGQRPSVSIYGTDYPTEDGTCVRDYIHIEDLCSAHLLALAKLEKEAEQAYNLGNGRGYTVRQVINTVRKVTGREFRVVASPRRIGDPAVLTACSDKAARELGWKVKYPQLDSIIESAWKWHSSHPRGYR